jgi:hypothetical protein
MKLRCRFGWHRWTKWEEVGTASRWVFADNKEKLDRGRLPVQGRNCEDCNKLQLRELHLD